jgi:hypothetical protein
MKDSKKDGNPFTDRRFHIIFRMFTNISQILLISAVRISSVPKTLSRHSVVSKRILNLIFDGKTEKAHLN